MDSLKECPFCGSSARMSNIGRGETRYVFCCGCRASMQSIKEWNTRPPSSQKEPVWPDKKIQGKHEGHYFDENYCYVCMDIVEENDPDPTGTNYKWNDAIDACIKAWKDSL